MDLTIEFIVNNYKWVFSGIGVFVLGLIFVKRASSSNYVIQKKIDALGDVVGRDKKR